MLLPELRLLGEVLLLLLDDWLLLELLPLLKLEELAELDELTLLVEMDEELVLIELLLAELLDTSSICKRRRPL